MALTVFGDGHVKAVPAKSVMTFIDEVPTCRTLFQQQANLAENQRTADWQRRIRYWGNPYTGGE